MFKEKSSKKRIHVPQNAKDSATLDARHQQLIRRLADAQASVQDLYQQSAAIDREIEAHRQKIDAAKKLGPAAVDSPEYEALWSKYLTLRENRQRLAATIREIEESREEIDYYEKTADILYQYYRLIELQEPSADTAADTAKLTSRGANTSGKHRRKLASPVAKVSILDAFAAAAATATPAATAAAAGTEPADTDAELDKSSLVDYYLIATDPNYIRHIETAPEAECDWCRVPLLCLQQEGIMVCPECGYQELLLVEQNRPILKAPTAKEGSHFSYKRINHFKEWCAQIQGKESTDIPEEVFEKILAEIKKEKIADIRKINFAKMRDILKKLKINKYYEHAIYIINRINGVPTPHFSQELEDRLCSMFKQIQGPFLKHCPRNRKNFLSYSYVLYKLMQILGLEEYLGMFQLLKSREKLSAQDAVFRKIAEDLGWPFYPSV